eukprot:Nk52_evm2s226 gene=Nk52_evmTU2s226
MGNEQSSGRNVTERRRDDFDEAAAVQKCYNADETFKLHAWSLIMSNEKTGEVESSHKMFSFVTGENGEEKIRISPIVIHEKYLMHAELRVEVFRKCKGIVFLHDHGCKNDVPSGKTFSQVVSMPGEAAQSPEKLVDGQGFEKAILLPLPVGEDGFVSPGMYNLELPKIKAFPFWERNVPLQGYMYMCVVDDQSSETVGRDVTLRTAARFAIYFTIMPSGDAKMLARMTRERERREMDDSSTRLAAQSNESKMLDFEVLREFKKTEEYETLSQRIGEKRPRRFVEAVDGELLSYREFIPPAGHLLAGAHVIFWHHFSTPTNKLLDFACEELCENHNVAAYNVCLRGHQFSGGDKSGGNRDGQFLVDIRTMIRHIKWNNPEATVVLAGVSSSASMILNYLDSQFAANDIPDGVVFLASGFGLKSNFMKPESVAMIQKQFGMHMKRHVVILNKISGGRLKKHDSVFVMKAVDEDGQVDQNSEERFTLAVMKQMLIDDPTKIIKKFPRLPMLAVCPENDEIVRVEKYRELGNTFKNVTTELMPGLKHLAIDFKCGSYIGKWIKKTFQPMSIKKNASAGLGRIQSSAHLAFAQTLSLSKINLSESGDAGDLGINNVLAAFKKTESPPCSFIEGYDGFKLCYYEYAPKRKPRGATIIWFTMSAPFFQPLACYLRDHFDIASVVFCLRGSDLTANQGGGEGSSKGVGDAVDREVIYRDMRTIIRHVKFRNTTPVFCGSSNFTSMLAFTYSEWKECTPVDGVIAIACAFKKENLNEAGLAKISNPKQAKPKSGGLFGCFQCGVKRSHNVECVYNENFLREVRRLDPSFMSKVSSTLVDATVSFDPDRTYKLFDKPVCVILGENDKVLRTQKVKEFCFGAFSTHRSLLTVEEIKDSDHLDVLVKAHRVIGPWLKSMVQISQIPPPPAPMKDINIDQFTINAVVGKGAFAHVCLAQHNDSSGYFALKVLNIEKMLALNQKQHVMDEKKLLQELSHPFVIGLLGTMKDEKNLYMLEEFIVGGELFTVLKLMRRFPERMAQFYICEILLAIEYLHSEGVVYRDLKPENIMVGPTGHLKLIDFGFGKRIGFGMKARTSSFVGTPEYMSPELIIDNYSNAASDVYAIGILCFELLSGRVPFSSRNHEIIFDMITANRFNFPPYFSANAKDFIVKLCSAKPEDRPGCGPGNQWTPDKGLPATELYREIKELPLLAGCDFKAFENFNATPPYMPSYKDQSDISNFIQYTPEELEESEDYAGGEGEVTSSTVDLSVFDDF